MFVLFCYTFAFVFARDNRKREREREREREIAHLLLSQLFSVPDALLLLVVLLPALDGLLTQQRLLVLGLEVAKVKQSKAK